MSLLARYLVYSDGEIGHSSTSLYPQHQRSPGKGEADTTDTDDSAGVARSDVACNRRPPQGLRLRILTQSLLPKPFQ